MTSDDGIAAAMRIERPQDLDWDLIGAVAWDGRKLALGDALLARIEQGRRRFLRLIANGVPCYGVTTGLGRLLDVRLDERARRALPEHVLLARAAAIGPPFDAPVTRAAMVIRLVNFLSARDGVGAALCRFLVARLNDGFTPWVPTLGHGMAADATANCHAFQTLVGVGYVLRADGSRQAAAEALAARGARPLSLGPKEGLALLNGVTFAPAAAMAAWRRLSALLGMANRVAAVTADGMAAARDCCDPALAALVAEPGVRATIAALQRELAGSEIAPHKLQPPVSVRVVPQVHGALLDALDALRTCVERLLGGFTGNPLLVADDDDPRGGRLLAVGAFHHQHLVNQVEQTALALAHVGALAERRLHRLLDAGCTGLAPQLAARPGLDAGLVVTQKAALDIAARLKSLASPLSLQTGESSQGQEDYMAMAIPAILRLDDMAHWVEVLLAYELLAGVCALRQRGARPGRGVAATLASLEPYLKPFDGDRPPGPDVERILDWIRGVAGRPLTH